MISVETFDDDKDMTCLTRRYQKGERKHRGLQKAENSNRAINANHLCHKCEKPGHFIRDCPMHNFEVKTYQRPGVEKDKNRDLVPDKKARKVEVGYIMKKAFDVWGNSSSDSDESECHRNKKRKGPDQQSNKQKKGPGQQKNLEYKGPGHANQ
nr:uncharacterized protein LOC104644714 [Solanum lycopersicum]